MLERETFDYRRCLKLRSEASDGDDGKAPEMPVFLQYSRRTMPYFSALPLRAEGLNAPSGGYFEAAARVKTIHFANVGQPSRLRDYQRTHRTETDSMPIGRRLAIIFLCV
jgi:hypothetical protein